VGYLWGSSQVAAELRLQYVAIGWQRSETTPLCQLAFFRDLSWTHYCSHFMYLQLATPFIHMNSASVGLSSLTLNHGALQIIFCVMSCYFTITMQ